VRAGQRELHLRRHQHGPVARLLDDLCAAEPALPEYTCNGTQQCTADGWGACGLPADVCDGLDNNCDGQIDEAYKDASGPTRRCSIAAAATSRVWRWPCRTRTRAARPSGPVPTCSFACKGGYEDVNGLPGDGCECQPQPGPDLAGDGVDSDCDGIDGEIDAAIFVAKDGGDDNPGTIDAPMLTVEAATARAFDTGKRDVYVATGVYSESVLLRDGIGVFGGYASNFRQQNVITFETAIIGQDPTPSGAGAVNGGRCSATAGAQRPDDHLDGFTVFGANAANVAERQQLRDLPARQRLAPRRCARTVSSAARAATASRAHPASTGATDPRARPGSA
jgi:hypothetical protein